ncbi:hypothetical protein [Sphingosinicella sp. YJ22]|uniref:hypothetical protein n=1 Tax=Sphingosinicella sp. YJ22 TaxID=1104780 RepID=UPI001408E552|nr:hypothetical protein [Sphingosinicella sp. YJ22]
MTSASEWAESAKVNIPTPAQRCLRVYAFDPQASLNLDTAVVNDAMIQLPWEGSWEGPLDVGPVNDYLEVVDYDAASGCFYPPVDLNNPHLLAQNGFAPSDGNPQFHQQMVFAVAMKTIRDFERALGRPVFWMREGDPKAQDSSARFRAHVKRLRVYPHAMREANAYYSPRKAALLFGYFRGKPARDGTGGDWVFTCLSQDIVAHETAHAILHGMWPRSIESCNPDALAFHEAFADLVALFRKFTVRPVIEHELAKSGGTMRSVSLLNGLAQQFGRATGREGPLRFALRMVKEEEEKLAKNERLEPDRNAGITKPHERGQILVAAVFDAFVTIFERRTADLFRIAGRAPGESSHMPPDLVRRIAAEAEKVADQVLRMCIRGLDYLPPVDVTFGEYLRAIITADHDLVPSDDRLYRVAFAEAFRKRGITAPGSHFTSIDSLLWDEPEKWETTDGAPGHEASADASFSSILSQLHLGVTFANPKECEAADEQAPEGARAYLDPGSVEARNLRDLAMHIVESNRRKVHSWLVGEDDRNWEATLGICLRGDRAPATVYRGSDGVPKVEVHTVRVSRRQGPDGQVLAQLIVQITQRRRAYYKAEDQQRADSGAMAADDPRWIKPDFVFRGGSTLIVDLKDGRVRRVVRKSIRDERRLARQRAYLGGDPEVLTFRGRCDPVDAEPFAFMHRSGQ